MINYIYLFKSNVLRCVGVVKDVYRLGARRMGVFGLAPLGCLPSQRSLKGGVDRKCVDLYNQVAEMFNHKLIAELSSLNARYPDATLVYVDIYNLPLHLIQYPQTYGNAINLLFYSSHFQLSLNLLLLSLLGYIYQL